MSIKLINFFLTIASFVKGKPMLIQVSLIQNTHERLEACFKAGHKATVIKKMIRIQSILKEYMQLKECCSN